jgi:hypothetical protein
MIFCDRCRGVVSAEDHCVYERRDFHPHCLETIRTARLIIEFAEWYDVNGTLDLNATSNVHNFFASWLEKRGMSIALESDVPRPPLPFLRR